MKMSIRYRRMKYLRAFENPSTDEFLNTGPQYLISCLKSRRADICLDIRSINKRNICNLSKSELTHFYEKATLYETNDNDYEEHMYYAVDKFL